MGSELIPPSEWLPVIWGGEELLFQTEEEMRTVLGAIMGRYNEIVVCLDTDPDDFEPIFWEGPEGEVIASDWAGGFFHAVALRPDAWEPLVGHEDAGILMAPLFLLNGDMEIDDAADEDKMLAQASDMNWFGAGPAERHLLSRADSSAAACLNLCNVIANGLLH